MSDYLISQQLSSGENVVYTAGQGPLDLLSFSIVKLTAGEKHTNITSLGDGPRSLPAKPPAPTCLRAQPGAFRPTATASWRSARRHQTAPDHPK